MLNNTTLTFTRKLQQATGDKRLYCAFSPQKARFEIRRREEGKPQTDKDFVITVVDRENSRSPGNDIIGHVLSMDQQRHGALDLKAMQEHNDKLTKKIDYSSLAHDVKMASQPHIYLS
jgi:hypothetical protein